MSWSGLSDTGKNDLSFLLLLSLTLQTLACFPVHSALMPRLLLIMHGFFSGTPCPSSLLGAESEKIVTAAAQRLGEKSRGSAQRLPSFLQAYPVAALTLITLNLLFRGCSFLSLKGYQNYPEMSMTEVFESS